MKVSGLALRYSKALYELAAEKNQQDKFFVELRAFEEMLKKEKDLAEFLVSPLVLSDEKVNALTQALEMSAMDSSVKNFLLVLADKDRFGIFEEIVEAYQHQADESHGVTRGTVRSASVLGPEERKEVEKTVSKVTGKQVILNYTEDQALIGGLVAQVGSYTFDDSLSSHLNRLKEEINRRTV